MMNNEYDTQKIEDTLLALLGALEFDNGRFWKGYDFGYMESLYKQGYITEPWGHTKSAYLTEEGMVKAKQLAAKLFAPDTD